MKIEKKEKIYIRNLLLTTIFGGIIGFINYLFNIFIARFTPEYTFALYSTAIGLIYLIQIPFTSIQNVLTKGVGESKEGNIERLKQSSVIAFTLIGILVSLLFFLLTPILTDPTQISPELILPLSVALLLTFISPISRGILLGQEKVLLVNSIWFLETLLRFVIGYIGIKMGGNIQILILASALPSFLSSIVALPFIKSKKEQVERIKIDFKAIALMTVSLLLLSAPYTLDLILAPLPLKAEYGALSLIGKIVYFSCTTIAMVMFARLANQKNEKAKIKTLGVAVIITLLIGIGMSIFIYIFRDLIVSLAFGDKYGEISTHFITFGILMSAYAVTFMFANFFFSRDSYVYIFILILITVLQVILFNRDLPNIQSIVLIQMFVYGLLLLLTILYFLFNFIFKKDVKVVKENI
jgi:O-antigen/teichoic acid export membrane protein